MHTRQVGGFTLIEVLVAILVLAVGIFGAVGAQVAALRARQGTALMSAAVQLAGATADRMRANAGQMQAGDNPYLRLAYDAATEGEPAAPGSMCFAAANCGSGQLAQFDLYEIKQALYAGFPDGRVAVCRDAAVVRGRALTWECAGGAGAPVVVKLGWRARVARGEEEGDFAPSVALVVAGAFP